MTATDTRTARTSTSLAQIVAIEEGTKTRSQRALTDAYHLLQKTPPLSGIARTYRPAFEDGEMLPGESTRVQVRVDKVTDDVATALARMLNVMVTKDTANQSARADVIVNGAVLLPNMPVTFLLTLEKKLADLRTFFTSLPVLDVADTWTYDTNAEAWATPVSETARTKKIPRNHVKAPATDKHPAQVELYTEDIVVGYWSTTRFSGAIPASRRTELITRVEALINAVKFAREAANSIPVTDVEVGADLFAFLLG